MFYIIDHGRFYSQFDLKKRINLCFDRYAYELKSVDYKYRRQCPDSSDYDAAQHKLQIERLESFPWNTLDSVVTNHGVGDHKLSDVRKIIEEMKRFSPFLRQTNIGIHV